MPVDALTLLDIDPERLAVVGALAERMVRKAGWSGKVRLTDRREEALEGAGTRLEELAAIAVTVGPGLVGSLLVGLTYAKSLSIASGVPLMFVTRYRSRDASYETLSGVSNPVSRKTGTGDADP